MRGLKVWTFSRPIWARRSRRMSSSLLPLNMLPVMTSIQPAWARRMSSTLGLGRRPARSGAALVLARLGVDADDVPGVDERRHRDDDAGLAGRRLGLRRRRGALDAGRGVDHLEIDRRGQLDADRIAFVELDLDRR